MIDVVIRRRDIGELHVTRIDCRRTSGPCHETDTVKSLETAVQCERPSDFIIKHQTVGVQPDEGVSNLPSLEFEIVKLFKFDSAHGEVWLQLAANAIAGNALSKLAEHFAIAADWIELSVHDSILSESDRMWPLAGRVSCIFSHCKVTIIVGDNWHMVPVDCDVPFSDMKIAMTRELGLVSNMFRLIVTGEASRC